MYAIIVLHSYWALHFIVRLYTDSMLSDRYLHRISARTAVIISHLFLQEMYISNAVLCVYHREEQTLEKTRASASKHMGYHAHNLGCAMEDSPCADSQV